MIRGETIFVFADDWGVHPSSAQHLFRRFLPENRVVWFETVGLRLPRPTLRDGRKLLRKLARWTGLAGEAAGEQEAAPEIRNVPLAPLPLGEPARRLNAWELQRSVAAVAEGHGTDAEPFVVSTLPLTADLIGAVPGATFVYYLVDDYGSWPGLGSELVRRMDGEQMAGADLVVAASMRLRDLARERAAGRVEYLPHGVDVSHFAQARAIRAERRRTDERPLADVVFFGAFDERIDQRLLARVIESRPHLRFLLLGPDDRLDPALGAATNVVRHPAVSYADLPEWLGHCDVAILPYVTGEFGARLSPLKAREAIASGLPVVGTDVPELRRMGRGISIGRSASELADLLDRTLAGADLPALEELDRDSWEARAGLFSEFLLHARAAAREAVA